MKPKAKKDDALDTTKFYTKVERAIASHKKWYWEAWGPKFFKYGFVETRKSAKVSADSAIRRLLKSRKP